MRLVSCFFLFLSYFSYSQEIVSDLIFNTQIGKNEHLIYEKSMISLSLPFFDDFSNYKGYPKSTHWQDQDAFINTNLPFGARISYESFRAFLSTSSSLFTKILMA